MAYIFPTLVLVSCFLTFNAHSYRENWHSSLQGAVNKEEEIVQRGSAQINKGDISTNCLHKERLEANGQNLVHTDNTQKVEYMTFADKLDNKKDFVEIKKRTRRYAKKRRHKRKRQHKQHKEVIKEHEKKGTELSDPQNKGGLKGKLKDIWNSLLDRARGPENDDILDQIKDYWNKFMDKNDDDDGENQGRFSQMSEKAKKYVKTLVEKGSQKYKEIGERFKKYSNFFGYGVTPGYDEISEKVKEYGKNLLERGNEKYNEISEKLGEYTKKILEEGKNHIGYHEKREKLNEYWEKLKSEFKYKETREKLRDYLERKKEEAQNHLANNENSKNVKEFWEKLKEKGKNYYIKYDETKEKLRNYLERKKEELENEIADNGSFQSVRELWKQMKEKGKNITNYSERRNNLINYFKRKREEAEEHLGNSENGRYAKEVLEKLKEKGKNYIRKAKEKLGDIDQTLNKNNNERLKKYYEQRLKAGIQKNESVLQFLGKRLKEKWYSWKNRIKEGDNFIKLNKTIHMIRESWAQKRDGPLYQHQNDSNRNNTTKNETRDEKYYQRLYEEGRKNAHIFNDTKEEIQNYMKKIKRGNPHFTKTMSKIKDLWQNVLDGQGKYNETAEKISKLWKDVVKKKGRKKLKEAKKNIKRYWGKVVEKTNHIIGDEGYNEIGQKIKEHSKTLLEKGKHEYHEITKKGKEYLAKLQEEVNKKGYDER
uniref:Uncharacterized protein n=1 Tax=Cacopsylla melanoneura TaxID=428564 RepID=A0A8D8YZ69_9HEMI